MADKTARAQVEPVRQRTQYTCMSASMAMCLQALGHNCDEDEVNKVMGATPMRGAAWEQALATAQHYGCRATLTMPSTVRQLKKWTDAGIPVMIAWNPEGRDWSHASTVYHVAEGPIETLSETQTLQGSGPGLYVYVADPNIPNPDKVTRIVHEDLFYGAWYEKFPNYLVRRPACAIAREVTQGGRQVMASMKTAEFTESDLIDLALDFKKAVLADRTLRDIFKTLKVNTDGKAWQVFAEVPGWSHQPDTKAAVHGFDPDPIARKHGLKPKGRVGGTYITPGGQQVNLSFAGGAYGTKVAEAADCKKDYDAGGLTWEEYQECLKRYEGGGYGGYSRRRRKPRQPVPDNYSERAKKLLLALAAAGDHKGYRFIKDNLYKSEMTEKQLNWFMSLERRYNRLIRDMPDDLNIVFLGGTLGLHNPSDRAKTKLEKYFWVKPDRDKAVMLLDKSMEPKSEPESSSSTPSGRHTFDRTRTQKMLDILDQLIARNPGLRMLPAFKRDLKSGKGLTEKQLKAVRRTLYKNRMRPQADMFRLAAEETEMAGRRRKKDKMKTPEAPKRRNMVVKEMVERGWGSGKHHNRERDVQKGRSRKRKHKKDYRRERYASATKVADRFLSACGMNGDCSCKCSIPDNKETSDV